MIAGQLIQNPGQAREHPAIAATPENLPAGSVALADEAAVAKIQMFVRIVEIVGGRPELGVRVIEITRIAAGLRSVRSILEAP